mgnify:CR=1 FL=1
MACVWVHLSIVQSTFLPTSLPKGNGSWLYGAGLTVSQTLHKIKVQGVLNKPHYKERKMNTEFWISNTTTCSDLISPSPILISASLPRLTRGGECRQVSICRTHLIGLHTTWLHVNTQNLTELHLMNCTNMIGSLSISDDVSFYLPENRLLLKPYYWCSSPILLLPLTFASEIVVWFRGEDIQRSMFVKHEDGLGFTSPRPLWLALIVLHTERVYAKYLQSQLACVIRCDIVGAVAW